MVKPLLEICGHHLSEGRRGDSAVCYLSGEVFEFVFWSSQKWLLTGGGGPHIPNISVQINRH